jgi:rhamnosyltransferase
MDSNNIAPRALILLSTYNGEKYLAAQLDSLIAQTHSDWILLIRDDGSTDNTLNILQCYVAKDARIQLINDNLGNLNVIKSYACLMEEAIKRQEPYIFFCDQDDIWLSHKMQTTINLLQQIEDNSSARTPVLVHTDLHVVDSQLNTIHNSYLQFEGLKRNPASPLNTLLINNYITGCTVGMNRALLQLAAPMPDSVRMHDWWCGLCAAASGVIGFIDEPTILYRQHGNNSVGSSGVWGKLKEVKQFKKSLSKRKKNLTACFEQARHLKERITDNKRLKNMIQEFTTLPAKSRLSRYYSAGKLKLKPAGFIRRASFWILLNTI